MLLFADDTCLLLSNTDLHILERNCNRELVHINNWFLANKLTANLSKASKYMLTVGKRTTKHPNDFRLTMGNTVLEKVSQVKYLGVIFDDRFTWHDHITYLCKKLSCSVGILSKLRYFVNVQTLLKVYYALVHSHLSYSLIVWGAAGVTALKPLTVLQNRAIRFISRAGRYRRLDLDYVNLRVLKLCDMYHHSIGNFMHLYHNDKLPQHFSNFFLTRSVQHEYNLRRLNTSQYLPIVCNKASMRKSIRYAGPNIWASCPQEVQSVSINKFKKTYKTFLLSEM